jgi:hypothetical protein
MMTRDQARELCRQDSLAVGWMEDENENVIKIVRKEPKNGRQRNEPPESDH